VCPRLLYFGLNELNRGFTVKLSALTLNRQGYYAMVPSDSFHPSWREHLDEVPESMKKKLVIAIATIIAKVADFDESYHECSNVVGSIVGSMPAHSITNSTTRVTELWVVALHVVTLTTIVSYFVESKRQFTGKAQQVANFTTVSLWSCTFRGESILPTWLLRLSWFIAVGGPAMFGPSATTLPDQYLLRAKLYHSYLIHRDRRITEQILWPEHEWPVMSWS
jgi:hypothetical protein